jgi:hypothetical protein
MLLTEAGTGDLPSKRAASDGRIRHLCSSIKMTHRCVTKIGCSSLALSREGSFPREGMIVSAMEAGGSLVALQPAVLGGARNGEIEFRVVNNGCENQSSIVLAGLKCLITR